MDSFRPQCDFFICFHNDTVSFLCYEKSVSEKYSCWQIRMITYLLWSKLSSLITMKYQISVYFRLWIHCFLQCTNVKVACNVAVCNTGYHAAVIQIYNGAIITYLMICKKKVCEIGTPFLIDSLCCKILFQLVVKYSEYYGAAEPPVRCGESHLSGLTEPLRSL